jgi:adenylate kinase family enzyme
VADQRPLQGDVGHDELEDEERLQVEDQARLAAALAVLHAVLPAVPVLPHDPFQVLDLEREHREDPEREQGAGHGARLVANAVATCTSAPGLQTAHVRMAVIGPSGSGKTWVSERLAHRLGLRHVEIDALYHGPNWEQCTLDELRERVAAATEGDGWLSDGTYHQMIGEIVLERAQTIVWLDLPARLIQRRLFRRTYLRKKRHVELWHGNLEGPWRESLRYLMWPSLKRSFENRRKLPSLFARHPHLEVHRLRSDRAVRTFVESWQPGAARPSLAVGSA